MFNRRWLPRRCYSRCGSRCDCRCDSRSQGGPRAFFAQGAQEILGPIQKDEGVLFNQKIKTYEGSLSLAPKLQREGDLRSHRGLGVPFSGAVPSSEATTVTLSRSCMADSPRFPGLCEVQLAGGCCCSTNRDHGIAEPLTRMCPTKGGAATGTSLME